MEFTEQQMKIDRILEFLKPYDTLDYDEYKHTICDKHNDILIHSLCDDDECVKIAIKDLRKELPKYSRLEVERYCNDIDHNSFEECEICGKNLNKYLTYYDHELNYLIDTIKTKEEAIKDFNAFKIVGLLESVGWISEHLNSKEAKKELLEFIDLIYSFEGVAQN
jgi:hypothetical protein